MSEVTFHHLKHWVERGVLVLTILEAELRGDAAIEGLKEELFEAVERYGAGRVVLDLHQVRYLASAGFQPLITLHRKLQDTGGQMVLCGLSPILTEVFRVTKLMRSSASSAGPFESEPDVPAAVARLAPADPG